MGRRRQGPRGDARDAVGIDRAGFGAAATAGRQTDRGVAEPAFAETAETAATARFPRDSVVDGRARSNPTLEVMEPVEPPGTGVGPILPPGDRRPLDLTPAEIDGLADSLPAEVMSHDSQLQSAADASSPHRHHVGSPRSRCGTRSADSGPNPVRWRHGSMTSRTR